MPRTAIFLWRFKPVEIFPARQGIAWLRDSWQLMRQQFVALMGLLLMYLGCVFLIACVPFIGSTLVSVAMPVLMVGFLQGIRLIIDKQRASFKAILETFPKHRVKPLLLLGLYSILAILTIFLVSIPFGGDTLWQLVAKKQTLEQAGGWESIFVSFAVFILLYSLWMCAQFFAPFLIAWQEMPVGKALFFSFMGIFRNWKACSVCALGSILVIVCVPMLGSILFVIVVGSVLGKVGFVAASVLAALFLVAVTSGYLFATQFFAYRDLFMSSANDDGESLTFVNPNE